MSTAHASEYAWHQALLYTGDQQYVNGVLNFADSALSTDRPLFVAVPAAHGALLRRHLDGRAERVRFADMTDLGRNPSRIIPAIRQFIDAHPEPVSFVGEPIWPGRTPAEVAEATRHEALINAAFDGTGARVLCPYDVSELDPAVVADAHRTHPELIGADGRTQASARYSDPHVVWQDTAHLPLVPAHAEHLRIGPRDLADVRHLARRAAARAGLPTSRADDLILAVTELATNSVLHGGGGATVTVWPDAGRVLCEVSDSGALTDPLAGRRRPAEDAVDGRGLWLVNQLCDLVQLHSSATETRVRITVAGHTG